MTNLEILLIAIIWLGYGLFAIYQSKNFFESPSNEGMQILFIGFAPILFIVRALYGAFKTY